jgi:hypothetical protein
MGSWPCLWVVLHGEGSKLAVVQALERPVVEVVMRPFDSWAQTRGIDRKAVVLGSDLHATVGYAPHGVIGTVVAKGKLEG